MTDHDANRPTLSKTDADLVALVEAHSRAPQPTAARRVAFQEELDRRIARRSWRILDPRWIGAAAVAVAALLFMRFDVGRDPATPMPESLGPLASTAAPTAADSPSVDALLSILDVETEPTGSELPDDYVAIGSLFLGT